MQNMSKLVFTKSILILLFVVITIILGSSEVHELQGESCSGAYPYTDCQEKCKSSSYSDNNAYCAMKNGQYRCYCYALSDDDVVWDN
uniref:Putative secreted salivary protein n=1 Tax=Xenopsylla cheopis TaxID=163159 RepID=A2IA81_XENCH|nr:putative secreted salivary protein [Xenopsylla cheopis]